MRLCRLSVSLIVCLAALQLSLFQAIAVGAEEFHYPLKLAVAPDGTIYVADLKLPGILAVKEGKIEKYFTASKKMGSPLNRVRCVAIDRNGKLLAGDTATREIYRFDEPGKPTPLTKGANAGIGVPMAIAVDSKGNIFVADLEVQWVWKIPSSGGVAAKFAEVPSPRGMAVDSQDRLWVVSGSKDQLFRIGPDGKVEIVVSGRPFQFPNDVVVRPDGIAYISDNYAKTVWKVPSGGKPEPFVTDGPLVNPVGLALKGDTLLIADPNPKTNKGHVYQADAAGKLLPLVGK